MFQIFLHFTIEILLNESDNSVFENVFINRPFHDVQYIFLKMSLSLLRMCSISSVDVTWTRGFN